MKSGLYSLVFWVLLQSCQPHFQIASTEKENFRIVKSAMQLEDSLATNLIQPYKQHLDSLMNIQIATAGVDMSKGVPEGSLGNLLSDLLMEYAKEQGLLPDFCVLNNGGIRIPTLYQGPVYIRTVYELMPFDNQLVLLKLKGEDCKTLFELIGNTKGVPISGLTLHYSKDNRIDAAIQGKSFDQNMEYQILTSDYLANGGDNLSIFGKAIARVELNNLIRDIFILKFKEKGQLGIPLQAKLEGRISYE